MSAPRSGFTSTRIFILACSGFTAAIAASVLAGWAFDIAILKTALPNYPEMKPVTAVSFTLIAIALAATAFPERNKLVRYLPQVFGFGSIAISLLMLGAAGFHFSTGADSFLLPDVPSPGAAPAGSMSPHSTLGFVLIGISFLFLRSRGPLKRVGGFAAIFTMAAAFAALLGHLYGADLLYGVSRINGTAVHTVLLFKVVASALVWQNRELGAVRLLRSSSLSGAATRSLVPVVILIPTVVGGLRVLGQEAGLYDTGFGTAASALLMVGVMLTVVFRCGRAIHKSEEHRRRAETELIAKEQRYRELFDYSQGLICIHDCNGILKTVNPAVLHLTGYSREELVGRDIAEMLPEEHRSGMEAFYRTIINEGIAHGLMPVVAKNGRRMMWRYNSILVTEDGREPYVIGHGQDVSELIAAQNKLKSLSLTDELTGLLNRRGFLHLADQQLRLERHNGTARGLNLLFADMDGLKTINDTIGHEAGSEAIKALADAVKSVVRSGDLVARWGGDEFVILTIGAEDENVDLMIERIERRLEEHNAESGKPYEVACSIGKAPVKLDGDRTFEEIIAEADEAMYAAKRRRKVNRADAEPNPEMHLMHDGLAWY